MSLTHSPTEKLIFGPYFQGKQFIFGDPVYINRKLQEHLDGQANQWIQKARDSSEVVAGPAKDRVIAAVRQAFQMAEWDPTQMPEEQGATEQNCWDALNNFLKWIESKKVNTGKPQTS